MKGKSKDMTLAPEQAFDKTMEDVHELSDETLKSVVGGADILDRVKPPSNDRPPIEAPILNPFG